MEGARTAAARSLPFAYLPFPFQMSATPSDSTERGFDPWNGTLDAQIAWRDVGGLPLDEANAKFRENPLYYQEVHVHGRQGVRVSFCSASRSRSEAFLILTAVTMSRGFWRTVLGHEAVATILPMFHISRTND